MCKHLHNIYFLDNENLNNNMHQGRSLEHYLKENKINITNLSDELQISRTQLYKYFHSQKLEQSTIDKFEAVLKIDFAKISELYVNHLAEPYVNIRRKLKQSDNIIMVPLVPFKARAGYAHSYTEVDYIKSLQKYQLPPGIDPRGSEFRWFEVAGDSMEPVLHNEDIILCSLVPHNDWKDLKDFLIYTIICKEDVHVKRVAKKGKSHFVLISEDDEHHDQVLVERDEIRELWRLRRQLNAQLPPTKRFKIRV
jgi:phage repressor protein C with HTH and peptisase S24 domain